MSASFQTLPPPPAHERAAPEDTAPLGLRCLVVDDSTHFLEAARTLLEREGLPVVGTTSTSAEALHLVRTLRPDVVLVDIALGPESGFELARRVVEDAGGSHPSVILISTHAGAEFADLIAESPAAGFLAKADLSADAIQALHASPSHPGGLP